MTQPARHVHRRGTIMIYTTVAMVAFAALVSLGVDAAHVRLVKRQLQTAADAAARYAASGIPGGVSAAQSNAVTAAGANNADGTAVVVDATNDVDFGNWAGGTFTVLSGSARSTANAVRVTCRRTSARGNAVVTSFALLIGKSSCDVLASAIAAYTPPPGGIIGLNWVSMMGNPIIDSFNSTVGPYSAGSASASGNVASNGNITLANSATVRGNATPGPGGSVSISGTASVSGSTSPATRTLTLPMPTLPASYTELGAVNLSGSATQTLSGGNYHCSSLTMSNSAILNVTGPVTLYVDGTVNIGGNSVLNVAASVPANFKIRLLGSGDVSVTNSGAVYADIYAPQSNVTCNNAGGIFGAAIGLTLTVSNSGGIHFDTSLPYVNPTISTVQ